MTAERVERLRRAEPSPWHEQPAPGRPLDRGALCLWLLIHFDIDSPAGFRRRVALAGEANRVEVDGVAYEIPRDCYGRAAV